MVFGFLNPALDFMFGWLLNLGSFWALLILSFIISVVIVVIYKYTTNQQMMKQLKEEMKECQKQAKELRQHPEKALEAQKKAMQCNMKYMSHSMKSTLITFLPIIIIFGWMNAHLAFEPIMPGQQFSMLVNLEKGYMDTVDVVVPDGILIVGNKTAEIANNQALFAMKAEKEGTYLIEFDASNQTYTKELLVTKEKAYAPQIQLYKNQPPIKSIAIGYTPVKVIKLGFLNLSWLWSYIIFSIVFSMILRKIMKVY
jgi:uncharacterized membrane protein (DUF106 family)